MVALDITPAEIQSARMSPEHLQAAVRAMQEDGFVVLNDVVDRSHLERLRERMAADLEQILARKDAPFNFNTGNVQQDPPPFPPYLFRDVLLNEMVIVVTKALLGPGLFNAFYSGNTALPGGKRQPVHADSGQLWENLEEAHPPYALVVNVPVVDMDAENGSTELWPGTHRDTTACILEEDIKIPETTLTKQCQTAPPLQPSVRCGSVLIRDMRLWHAGTTNHTETPRPMIAMIHFVRWWREYGDVPFPKGTESFFEHPDLKTKARFVEGPIDYLKHGHAYDLAK